MTNCPLSGRGQGHVKHSRISHPWSYRRQILCGCRLYQVLVFRQLTAPERGVVRVMWPTWPILEFTPHFVHGLATRSTNLQMTNCPISGRGIRATKRILEFHTLWNISGTTEAIATSNFVCLQAISSVSLVFGRPNIPEKGVSLSGWRDPFQNFTPLNFSGMAEDRIVKFCARVGAKSISLVMTNCPPGGRGQSHVTSYLLANKC